MTGQHGPRPVPTDDAIRGMIEARAERAGPIRFDASAVAARAVSAARIRPNPPSLLPRVAIAATSVAAAAVLAVVIALPLGSRPASAPPSNVSPATSPNGPARTAAPARVLSPAELGELVRARAAELDGTIVAVQGRLERDPSMPCSSGQICANTLLADSGAGFHLRPVGDIGPGPWDGSGPKTGTFAVRITAKLEGGRPVVDFVGDLVNRDDGTFVLSVADIVGGAVQMDDAYAAVDGWLVRTPLHPCSSDPHPPPGPTYGCPDDDWLTASEFQPLRPDGSTVGPANALYLPVGSYEQWAPDQAVAGFNGAGVAPRRATYLLWRAPGDCGPNADCAVVSRWRIVGRFDPIPNLGLAEQPAASDPIPSLVPPPTGTAWTVAALAGPSVPSGEFAVRGWLVATPALRGLCISPSGSPDYGCSERDWLTDEPFQPWVSDGTTGSTRDPSFGLRVQNGAYAAFALNPATGAFVAREPRLGTYRVRLSIHSTCDFVRPASPAPSCAGGPIGAWEVVARLEP